MNSLNLTKNMRLFKKGKQQADRAYGCSEKNFCIPEQFRQRLFLEKRRSERLNSHSSIILVNFEKYLKSERNFQRIIRLVCSNIRATDLVCCYKAKTIVLLLPDTESNGARCACKRLTELFIVHLKSDLNLEAIDMNDFEIEILSYPERQSESSRLEDRYSNQIPMTTVDRKPRRTLSVNSDSKLFSLNYYSKLNLSVSTYNGSVLAVPILDTFFWDQEAIKNFLTLLNKYAKRALDIIVSIIGLIFSIPIMLPIALMIKLTSKGPVFFKQDRIGYRGKNFTFYKFRTMFQNNDCSAHQEYMRKHINGNNEEINNGEKDDPLYKMKNDSRITPIGKLLRKTSLDELPQLWNVLKGEMSLVGPRPPIPYEVEQYQTWHYRRVIEVKPGITGLWQVSGRNRTTFDEMVRLDIHYAQNWSFLMDLKILFKTAKAVFMGEGN